MIASELFQLKKKKIGRLKDEKRKDNWEGLIGKNKGDREDGKCQPRNRLHSVLVFV